MKVVIASKNPVKIACIKQAFTTYFPEEDIGFEDQEVDSGVSEQPLTTKEAIQGAVNRAKAVANPKADYSVGIEGGLSFYEINDQEYGVEISWVCVYDCQKQRSEIASAPGFPVFPKVLKHIHAGLSLSDAMSEEYGIEEIGKKNGYIGWLSDDHITRQSSNFEAVYLALSSLVKEGS